MKMACTMVVQSQLNIFNIVQLRLVILLISVKSKFGKVIIVHNTVATNLNYLINCVIVVLCGEIQPLFIKRTRLLKSLRK